MASSEAELNRRRCCSRGGIVLKRILLFAMFLAVCLLNADATEAREQLSAVTQTADLEDDHPEDEGLGVSTLNSATDSDTTASQALMQTRALVISGIQVPRLNAQAPSPAPRRYCRGGCKLAVITGAAIAGIGVMAAVSEPKCGRFYSWADCHPAVVGGAAIGLGAAIVAVGFTVAKVP
jgi:hypothetical protein